MKSNSFVSPAHPVFFLTCILICITLNTSLIQQTHAQEGPLTTTGYISRDEIMLVYDEIYRDSTPTINERGMKLRKDYEAAGMNNSLAEREKNVRKAGSYGERHMDIISGDFNNDQVAEYLYTSSGHNDSLRLSLVSVDTALQPSGRTGLTVTGQTVEGKNLVRGDVNGDHLAEFAVAYNEFGTSNIRIGIYGITGDFNMEQLDIIKDLPKFNMSLKYGMIIKLVFLDYIMIETFNAFFES